MFICSLKRRKKYYVLKKEELLKINNSAESGKGAVFLCQQMMRSKANDYGLQRLLHLLLQIFFRKCEIRSRRMDLRVSIPSVKAEVSSSTNSASVKSVSLEPKQRV